MKMINEYEDVRKVEFLEAYLDTWCNLTESCKKAGISKNTFYKWKSEDMYFYEDWEDTVGYINLLKSRGLNKNKVAFV